MSYVVTCAACRAIAPGDVDALYAHHTRLRESGRAIIAFIDTTFCPDVSPLVARGLGELHRYAWQEAGGADPFRWAHGVVLAVRADVHAVLWKALECAPELTTAAWDRAVRVALRLTDDPVALQMAASGSADAFGRLVRGMMDSSEDESPGATA